MHSEEKAINVKDEEVDLRNRSGHHHRWGDGLEDEAHDKLVWIRI